MPEPPVRLFRVLMSPGAREAACRVLDSGWVGEGPEALAFEAELAASLGVAPAEVVTVNSCTSALTLALQLAGVGPGDEVISTPMTCAATNVPIVTRGARVVWADVDAETGLIAPGDVARRVTPRTRAVVAVDWGGRSADYAALRAAAPGIPIVQDAAQRAPLELAPGSFSRERRGDLVCFSFQAIKFVTATDGGALVAPGPEAERARLLRWYGMSRRVGGEARVRQEITEAGYKFHMNDLAAAIGRANLPGARAAVLAARANALAYEAAFAGVRGLRVAPLGPDDHAWLFTLLVPDPDRFLASLAEDGVEASRVHARNDGHPALGAAPGPLPGVDAFASRELAIPVGGWVGPGDRARVIRAVQRAAGGG